MRLLALLFAALSISADALPPIYVRASPRVALPPLDRVHIEAVIPRDKDNRAWCIVLDGPGLYSASCGPLEGEESAAIVVRDVWALKTTGEYVITAELYRRKTGPKVPFAVARTKVQVGIIPTSDEP